MIDLVDLMKTLAAQRTTYHSEADFQHAFAWEVHKRLPDASVRLERPIHTQGKSMHLDFLVRTAERTMAIELKYKTKKLSVDVDGEEFRLRSHGAQDSGRYDFIKDICRLENITASINNCEGWAILLTNESTYWKQPRTNTTVDAAFHINEGRILHGKLAWTEKASAGTKRNRETDLNVEGKYTLNWNDFSIANTEHYGKFRFLAVPVPRSTKFINS